MDIDIDILYIHPMNEYTVNDFKAVWVNMTKTEKANLASRLMSSVPTVSQWAHGHTKVGKRTWQYIITDRIVAKRLKLA